MSIRSVDLMVLFTKVAEVEKMQQQQQQAPQIAHQQLTQEEIQKKDIERNRLQKTPKDEGGRIERKKDGEGSRGGQHAQQQQGDEEEEKKNNKFKPYTGRSIDIRI